MIYRDSHSPHHIYSVSPRSPYFRKMMEQGFADSTGAKAIMTWAASHPKLGYLAEVLRYANIIDGLSEAEKRDMRDDLEVCVNLGEDMFATDENRIADLDKRFACKKLMVLFDEDAPKKKRKFSPCAELCPEYIDYLQELLKPYLKQAVHCLSSWLRKKSLNGQN